MRKRMFDIAASMLTFLHLESEFFMLEILKNDILGKDRLNVVVRLQYYHLSSFIVLGELLINQNSPYNLRRAAKNYPVERMRKVIRLVAENSTDPAKVVESMMEKECFERFSVDWNLIKWSDKKVVDRTLESGICGFVIKMKFS